MVVTISGTTLQVDGAAYEVRGVAYSPLLSYAERGTSPPDLSYSDHSAIWQRDLSSMAAHGVNTVRLYNWDPS